MDTVSMEPGVFGGASVGMGRVAGVLVAVAGVHCLHTIGGRLPVLEINCALFKLQVSDSRF
jgi:hypothetical protein